MEASPNMLTQSQPVYFIRSTGEYSVGGKAKNLFFLKEKGFRVPEFVVIPGEVLTDLLPNALRQNGNISEIRHYISTLTIDDVFIRSVLHYFPGIDLFSVRSSALDEDGANFSFAGQYDSFLYVRPENIAQKIKEVWLSSLGERVIAYRRENNLPLHSSIAVIIQKMINADASGVAFGANPASGDKNEKVISAVYGIGEGLVSGELDADTFYVKDSTIRKVIARKEKKRVFDSATNEGSVLKEVDAERMESSALQERQILEIASVLDRLFREYGTYQDVEFAIKGDDLYLLQARPITTLKESDEEYIVWDNSNIIESYPGVTSPLTFSFILPVYEGVYLQLSQMMGISEADIAENRETFANMLGLLRGRVYYNLLSWYKILSLLPGYSLNAEFMEKMMGVKERFELSGLKKRRKIVERLRVGKMVWMMLGNLRRLPKMHTVFVEEFNFVMKKFLAIDYEKSSAEELMNYYREFERTVLAKWKAPLVNDFFAMIYYGTLQKLGTKYKVSENASIHNDLLSGSGDIISTEPVRRIIQIAAVIEKHPKLKKIILDDGEQEIFEAISSERFSEVKVLVDEYLEIFGERCVGELKLETVTYKQNPLLFIRILKSYVEQGVPKDTWNAGNMSIRTEAENTVNIALAHSFSKRRIYSYVLRKSRTLISARENLRYERTRAFGIVRRIFCALGDRFYESGMIADARDIFYLTKEEIFAYIEDQSKTGDLKEIIALRKKEYKTFEMEDAPERIRTNIADYSKITFDTVASSDLSDERIHGIPCCAGIVRGRVRVIRDPKETATLGGDILVTSSTDPGWITLFPSASAILVERGSLLSHSAIVSREMGKPCIVGITGLLKSLKTGDMIEMNGGTGEITLLSRNAS